MLERVKDWWRGQYRPSSLDSILSKGQPDGAYVRPWIVRVWIGAGMRLRYNLTSRLTLLFAAVAAAAAVGNWLWPRSPEPHSSPRPEKSVNIAPSQPASK